MTSVAAAMIVRDEAHFLPGCLKSLQGKVDEIVVVDTGSRDATPCIAEDAGARVFHSDWIGDFAAARNRGLEQVSTDWVLYIDADERLRTPSDRPLTEFIDTRSLAATVRFQPKSGYTRYREWRLFRRDERLRFAGKIHETMMPIIEQISEREGLPLTRTSVEIDHLGYDGDQSGKAVRNIPLLRQAIEDDPGRVFCWYHLAETLCAINHTDEAVTVALRGLHAAKLHKSEKQRANGSLIFQLLARIRLERKQDPGAIITEGLTAMPEDYALQFLEARANLDTGDFASALGTAKRLLSVDPEKLSNGLLAFDRRIFGEFAYELAAVAAFRLGLFAEAAEYFSNAASVAPDSFAYRVKAEAAQLRQQQVGFVSS